MTVVGKGGRPKRSDPDEYDIYWNFTGSPWKTRSAWMGWIRSVLRKSWSRHPLKIAFIQKNRVKIPNPNPSSSTRFPTVWGAECQCCKERVPLSGGRKEKAAGKKVAQIDHIMPSGSLKTIKDVQGFFERLILVTEDSLRFLCNVCNKDYAYMDKYGVSLERAKAEREAIAIQKLKTDTSWLQERGIVPGKNAASRRKQLVEQIMKEAK